MCHRCFCTTSTPVVIKVGAARFELCVYCADKVWRFVQPMKRAETGEL